MAALTTEHFVLQSTASTTVSESGTRASLYVMALSSSLVAIGFSVGSKQALVPLVATVLPVVFLLGIFTVVRLVETGVQNLLCLRQIAHIHGYYRSLLPEAPTYFDPLGSFGATTTSASAQSNDPRDSPNPDRARAEKEHRAALAMLAIPQRRYVLTGLFSIAAMVAAINSIVGAPESPCWPPSCWVAPEQISTAAAQALSQQPSGLLGGHRRQLLPTHPPTPAADRLKITKVEVVQRGTRPDRDRVGREGTLHQPHQPHRELVPGIPRNLHPDARAAIAQQEPMPLEPPTVPPVTEVGPQKRERTLTGRPRITQTSIDRHPPSPPHATGSAAATEPSPPLGLPASTPSSPEPTHTTASNKRA